jgi:hypothetical protein
VVSVQPGCATQALSKSLQLPQQHLHIRQSGTTILRVLVRILWRSIECNSPCAIAMRILSTYTVGRKEGRKEGEDRTEGEGHKELARAPTTAMLVHMCLHIDGCLEEELLTSGRSA